MAAPNIPVQFPFPSQEQTMTYPELMEKLRCLCPAGAQMQASPPPSATINIGDIVADFSKGLASFTSVYSMITVILRMIACIIDVLCALVNPFALIFAIIKLFGTCLPDLILIFPQFAIPSIIICVIKIIIAIVQYVLTVIVPLILDIIQNVQDLIDAFSSGNKDAIAAVAFKIVALIKELFNIVGILAVLNTLFIMIKALLSMGISIPCGSSSDCCNEANCPTFIKDNTTVLGNDGVLYVIHGQNPYDYTLKYYIPSHTEDFLSIRDFFPTGLDYGQFNDTEKLPYVLIDNYGLVDSLGTSLETTYAATSVLGNGYLELYWVAPEMKTDGYLSNDSEQIERNWIYTVPTVIVDPWIRFASPTASFTPASVGQYLRIEETREGENMSNNSGTWLIDDYYDEYNVILEKADDGEWNGDNSLFNPPSPFINWCVVPIPTAGGPHPYKFEINHNELVRHQMISVGCHPAVKATIDGLNNRFPEAPPMPDLPDFDTMLTMANSCISTIAPITVDSQYVLEHYNEIAQNAAGAAVCLTDVLNNFQDAMVNYLQDMYPRVFDPERSADAFTASPTTQYVGGDITILFIPYDVYGGKMASGLPSGTIDVQILATVGTISTPVELLDAYGNITGTFQAILTHPEVATSILTAKVGDKYASDFVGNNLVTKEITVQFVKPQRVNVSEVSTEPLGKGTVK